MIPSKYIQKLVANWPAGCRVRRPVTTSRWSSQRRIDLRPDGGDVCESSGRHHAYKFAVEHDDVFHRGGGGTARPATA